MIDDLKVTDGLRRQLRAASAVVFVVVIDLIEVDRVASWPKTSEAEAAGALAGPLLQQRRIGCGNLRREKDECQIVAARNREFLDAIAVDVYDRRGLRSVEGHGRCTDVYRLLRACDRELDRKMSRAPHGDGN